MENLKLGQFGFFSSPRPFDPNKPTLVFIHGAAMTSIFWKSQVNDLAAFANTVAMDLPGHGDSQGSGKDNIPAYARAVMEFIDQIKAPQPIPCGLSLGGAVAQQLLIENNHRFSAGILINTGARLRVSHAIFQTIEEDYSKFVDTISTVAISKKSDAEKLRPEIEACTKCHPDVAFGDFKACDTFDVINRLGLIHVPVLVLTASDDNLTPAKYGNFLGERIAKARIVNIEAAGHLSPMEKPDEVNRFIRKFLQQIKE